MAFDTFPAFEPDQEGTSADVMFEMNEAQFGDGYEQASGVGINDTRRDWSVRFKLGKSDADTIISFLEARKGITPFYWTPPRESSAKLFRVAKFKQSNLKGDQVVISCKFMGWYGNQT